MPSSCRPFHLPYRPDVYDVYMMIRTLIVSFPDLLTLCDVQLLMVKSRLDAIDCDFDGSVPCFSAASSHCEVCMLIMTVHSGVCVWRAAVCTVSTSVYVCGAYCDRQQPHSTPAHRAYCNDVFITGQRHRRWPSMNTSLGQHLVCAA